MRSTNLLILALISAAVIFAAETSPAPQPDHKLTADEKVEIYKRLADREKTARELTEASVRADQANQRLQAALAVCPHGVRQDDKTGDIDCAPKPAEKPAEKPVQ